METEIRQLLRERAGDVGVDNEMPRSTLDRARRRRLLTGVVAAGTLAAVIVGAVVTVGAMTGSRAIDYVGRSLEPKRQTSAALQGTPADLAVGFGSIWAAHGSTIERIDARTGKIQKRIVLVEPGRAAPGGGTEMGEFTAGFETLTAGEDSMWVVANVVAMRFFATAQPIAPLGEPAEGQTSATFSMRAEALPPATGRSLAQGSPTPNPTIRPGFEEWSLLRIDPRDNGWNEVAKTSLTGMPTDMAAGAGSVWLTTREDGLSGVLWRFSENTGRLLERIPINGEPTGVAVQAGSIWVTVTPAPQGNVVLRIDPATNRIAQRIAIPGADYATAIAASEDDVWVAGGSGDEGTGARFVARIDARGRRLLGTIAVQESLRRLAAAGGVVWGVPYDERSLLRIVGNVLAGTFSVERPPTAITVDGERLWLGAVPAERNVTGYEF